MDKQTITYLIFASGAVASVLLPFLREYVNSKAAFNWRQLIGQFLATASVVAAQIVGLVDALGDASAAEAFFIGWGISSAGRFAQKGYDVVRRKMG